MTALSTLLSNLTILLSLAQFLVSWSLVLAAQQSKHERIIYLAIINFIVSSVSKLLAYKWVQQQGIFQSLNSTWKWVCIGLLIDFKYVKQIDVLLQRQDTKEVRNVLMMSWLFTFGVSNFMMQQTIQTSVFVNQMVSGHETLSSFSFYFALLLIFFTALVNILFIGSFRLSPTESNLTLFQHSLSLFYTFTLIFSSVILNVSTMQNCETYITVIYFILRAILSYGFADGITTSNPYAFMTTGVALRRYIIQETTPAVFFGLSFDASPFVQNSLSTYDNFINHTCTIILRFFHIAQGIMAFIFLLTSRDSDYLSFAQTTWTFGISLTLLTAFLFVQLYYITILILNKIIYPRQYTIDFDEIAVEQGNFKQLLDIEELSFEEPFMQQQQSDSQAYLINFLSETHMRNIKANKMLEVVTFRLTNINIWNRYAIVKLMECQLLMNDLGSTKLIIDNFVRVISDSQFFKVFVDEELAISIITFLRSVRAKRADVAGGLFTKSFRVIFTSQISVEVRYPFMRALLDTIPLNQLNIWSSDIHLTTQNKYKTFFDDITRQQLISTIQINAFNKHIRINLFNNPAHVLYDLFEEKNLCQLQQNQQDNQHVQESE